MIKTGMFASIALTMLVVPNAFVLASNDAEFKSVDPSYSSGTSAMPLHPRFRSHLKCPYADKWLAKGPEQAALELGLDEHGRKLRTLREAQGSCAYTDAFSGGPACLQFQGGGWTADLMSSRCAAQNGEWSADGCDEGVGGWCDVAIESDRIESTAMFLSATADCGMVEMACGSFMGGNFDAAGECLPSTSSEEEKGNVFSEDSGEAPAWPGAAAAGGAASAAGPANCLIAPGAIGAAHQAGFSAGYSSSCPGTPAQESPYMWPLSWSADVENAAMAYGSDDVVYRSRGRTFYMLDRNWKRSDTTFQEGVLRTIGQGPCDDIDEDFKEETGFLGCRKNQTDDTMSTMIHRGGNMYFITWKDGEDVSVGEVDPNKVAECTMMNLAVIGNIRPDWFLDKRGDDTDVQYLGDQHVYYADGAVPKLVKQWRKKDFASQYFVMSVTGNPPNKLAKDPNAPPEDDVHWPLILNIPGEGFGDDSLQVYRNHETLDESHVDLFELIENYEALGAKCVDVRSVNMEGEGNVGPPVLEESETIPSNLEVDPMSWVSNEFTFSPIWVAPVRDADVKLEAAAAPSAPSGKATLEVSDRLTVESCYDASSSSVDMSVHFHGVDPSLDGTLPWMALGYRPTELCAMTPPSGGNTPMILVTHDEGDELPQAHRTELLPRAKAYDADAFSTILETRTPLDEAETYAEVSLEAPMVGEVSMVARASNPTTTADEDTVSLHFKQSVEGEPAGMNLMYAIGMTPQLGSHETRGCFQLEEIPPCGGAAAADVEVINIDLGDLSGGDGQAAKSSAGAVTSVGVVACALLTIMSVIVGL